MQSKLQTDLRKIPFKLKTSGKHSLWKLLKWWNRLWILLQSISKTPTNQITKCNQFVLVRHRHSNMKWINICGRKVFLGRNADEIHPPFTFCQMLVGWRWWWKPLSGLLVYDKRFTCNRPLFLLSEPLKSCTTQIMMMDIKTYDRFFSLALYNLCLDWKCSSFSVCSWVSVFLDVTSLLPANYFNNLINIY